MNLTHFPFVTCHINESDENFVNSSDQFDKDIKKAWDAYDPTKVITIMVNLLIPHTGLKITTVLLLLLSTTVYYSIKHALI